MKTKIVHYILSFVLLFGIVISAVPDFAYAESGLKFDNTDVLDDLKSSTIDGETFNLKMYPYDEKGSLRIINFVEYCYSYRKNMRTNYGLYIYVYNPQGINIDVNSKRNKVQMAIAYDESGNPVDYAKFTLECVSVSSGDYRNLFYKFKVIDKEIDGSYIDDRVNSNERQYDISGIELLTYGDSNAIDYSVGLSYRFTGYSVGYGPDPIAKSTLDWSCKEIETLYLHVNHTYYRTKTSSKGEGYQNQVDTVYFAVPNEVLEKYGKLQRIKAEWYEYKTKDVFVTSNSDAYKALQPYLGKYIDSFDPDIGYALSYTLYLDGIPSSSPWSYNYGHSINISTDYILFYLLYCNNIANYDVYDYYNSVNNSETTDLYEYILNYDCSSLSGYLPYGNGYISADLFENDIDDSRKVDNESGKIQMGYSYYDFDIDADLHELLSFDFDGVSFFQQASMVGFWNAVFGKFPVEDDIKVSPIYSVKHSDLNLSDEELSENLLIHPKDVDEFREYCNSDENSNCTVFLFRFAKSDYFSQNLVVHEQTELINNRPIYYDYFEQSYRCSQSVFLNFDIIQLTFNGDGKYTVIPVVSNPIDIVNPPSSPVDYSSSDDDMPSLLKTLLSLVVILVLLFFLWPILPAIIKFVIEILMLPFKLIKFIINAFKKE